MALDDIETGDGNMGACHVAVTGFRFKMIQEQTRGNRSVAEIPSPPHIIEITNDNIKYVIAHADYPGSEYLFGKEMSGERITWPVDRVQKSRNGELQRINGADYLYLDI